MRGIIFLWFGPILDIPAGWALCDGSQGTPNLTTKFVIAAGTTYNPAATGGEPVHSHDFTGSNHKHDFGVGEGVLAGDDFNYELSTAPAAGKTGTTLGWPPYHALCYIMKLP